MLHTREDELRAIIRDLIDATRGVGTMHSNWDLIADMRSFLGIGEGPPILDLDLEGWIALGLKHLGRTPDAMLAEAKKRAEFARGKFGPHPSAEFACCRLGEEVGELIQAATSMSKGRHIGRAARMREEATDVIAMVLRLIEEFPDGRTEPPKQ